MSCSNGRLDLIHRGAVVLSHTTMGKIGRRLAEEGVDPAELVED